MENFHKSFSSTLKTLRAIKEESCEAIKDSNPPIEPPCGQLIVRETLADVFGQSTRLSHSTLTPFERSVMEQARSNDLKAFEINLTMEKLKLKKSQLYLSSYSNFLEKIKISMGIEKSTFREEKFKTQVRDSKHAELVKTCLDLLIAGLILMSCLLIYGAYAFSFKRISEATLSCSASAKVNPLTLTKRSKFFLHLVVIDLFEVKIFRSRSPGGSQGRYLHSTRAFSL